ncbi:hypothetical protein [Cognatilysobacter segetis]|uniref:hypothetical protein n=1 Tax=Cognatilysobacter segetis TaxID=2492394 RepID=UPI00105CCD2F|nr:hypothetical protein [Lysobacter segetis]
MYFGKPTRVKNAVFAALSFLLSALMFYSWATFDGIPPRAELQAASGKVSWQESGRYGIRFRLEGEPKAFDYASKGNALGLVQNSLSRRDRPVVHVLYDPNSASGPIYSKDTYYSVYELSVAGESVRSHEDIARAWRSDEEVAVWLAALFVLSGLYLS